MNASNSPLLANPKPEPRKKVKARATRSHAIRRADCRLAVYLRAQGGCEVCGKPLVLFPQDASYEFQIGHVHEVKPRSLGGDDTDPDNCQLLCYVHHEKAHGR
jgi:5-methylcytosine-specific restriction endonuclease McrA